MKIAHFNRGIYFQGGIGTYICSLARYQLLDGNEVSFFESSETEVPVGGIRPILVSGDDELFWHCKSLSIDILHHHSTLSVAPPSGLKVVCTVHEHSPHCISGGLFLKRRAIPCPRTYDILGCTYGHLRDHCGSLRPKALLSNVRRLKVQQKRLPGVTAICVGNFLKSRMIKSGYPTENLHVLPNFTDIAGESSTVSAVERPQFLFLGRLERMKGLAWLLQAFQGLNTPATLQVAGQGGEEASLKTLVRDLGVEGRVDFLGWVSGVRKLELLRQARAVIVPSLWHETFGLAAIEAAAVSIPVICSDSGELPYVIDHEVSGLVVKSGNVKDLTLAMERLASDQILAREMGARNHQKFRSLYTPEIHLKQLYRLYESAIHT